MVTKISGKSQANFIQRTLDHIPSWALGVLGLVVGVSLVFQVTGYNASAQRVIEAYVKRIELSAVGIDASAKRFEKVVAGLTADVEKLKQDVKVLSDKHDQLEAHAKTVDAKYHRGFKPPQ